VNDSFCLPDESFMVAHNRFAWEVNWFQMGGGRSIFPVIWRFNWDTLQGSGPGQVSPARSIEKQMKCFGLSSDFHFLDFQVKKMKCPHCHFDAGDCRRFAVHLQRFGSPDF
jgi:hypothetical protein